MTMTDPVADMLTRIRNANVALHDECIMPSSKVKVALAKILVREGYIENFSVEDATDRPGSKLRIVMKYTSERERTISGLRRVSKPGLRVYTKESWGKQVTSRDFERAMESVTDTPLKQFFETYVYH